MLSETRGLPIDSGTIHAAGSGSATGVVGPLAVGATGFLETGSY
ncbi:hypothetical protein [Halegenticoccus soli]|nr:hypothetical protein [Halegenticoccus soli]